MKKVKIQIETFSGSVLFEYETDNNTIRDTLVKAVFTGADLRSAYLRGAYLTGADLTGANLTGADLTGTYLRGADLRGANLTGADLTGAYLRGADLTGADLKKIVAATRIIPEVGSFIGWKKADGCLIKLEIPTEAKRHNSLGGRKCRAEFVKVLNITKDGKRHSKAITAGHGPATIYKIGEIVKPDSYDPDPLIECSNGIHFFISKQEALDW